MRTIELGDTVDIYWVEQNAMDQKLVTKNAEILHIPVDTGDFWHIKHEGNIYVFNPNCSILLGFKLVKKGKMNV